VLASDEIYEAINKFQDDTGKPVIASMGGVAASGGYYVSAPCQWVVAHPLTITGSIGVIMQGFNYRGLMDKFGVKPEVYKSGKHKDMLGGMRSPGEIPAGEQAIIQGLIDETFGRFKEIVKEGRSEAMRRNRAQGFEKDAKTLDEKWEEYADGRVFSGRIAYEKGFVDELGDQQVAIKRAKKIAGLSDASVVKYQMPFGFGNFLRILGKSNAQVIKVDAGLPGLALEPGLLYFMTPMFIRK